MSAALAAVPQEKQKRGMTVRYVQTSNNNYVQARLIANAFTTDVSQWQGVDDKPVPWSENLVKSGGVYTLYQELIDFDPVVYSSSVRGIAIDNMNIYNETITQYAGALFFEVIPGNDYFIATKDGKSAIVAILKNISNVAIHETPAFSDSYPERIVLTAGESLQFTCPEDSHYVYMTDNPDSELYGVADLSKLGLLGDVKIRLNKLESAVVGRYTITPEYGTLTGNSTSQGVQYDVNGLPNMRIDASSFHQYSRTPFISVKDGISFDEGASPTGIILMYGSDFSYIGQDLISDEITLPYNVRYVKMCITNPGQEQSIQWSQGSVDTTESEANRIKSDYISFENVGTVMFSRELRLFLRYYDSNHTLIGNSMAQTGIMINHGQIEAAFNPTVTGKTISDVVYMRFGAGEKNNGNIGTDSAPTVYAPGVAILEPFAITTIGGRTYKNRNEYNKTFRLVYDTPVNHLPEDVSTIRYYSTLMLRLPKNYTQDGTPTKLIIFKSGSRSFDEIFEADFLYLDYIKYWVDQGYAVVDYFGGTSKYPNNDSFGCATNIASANAAYNFLVNNFNIDKGGVYLSCKSLGGYTTHELIFNGSMPIKAAAMLAPGIDNKRYCFGYYGFQRLNFAADMGFTGDLSVLEGSDTVPRDDITIQYSDAFKTLLTNNIDKVYGYLPMFNGVINKTLAELLDLHPEVADAWADVKRIHRIPTRYWVAPDDTDTPYPIAANYVKSCQNAFCPVTLRTMPSGTGGHHSVDNAENAPKVASITTRLGVTYTNFPLAFVEALNFLERY